jgi:hypothetical protein
LFFVRKRARVKPSSGLINRSDEGACPEIDAAKKRSQGREFSDVLDD